MEYVKIEIKYQIFYFVENDSKFIIVLINVK